MVQLTKEESRTITMTKVICMFGVIWIHAAINKYVDCSAPVSFYYNFLTRAMVMFAVPGFFMCSGFLFFLNYKGVDSYKKKMASRIKGLLVPYIIWISLTMAVTWFLQDGMGLAKLFGAGNMKLMHDFTSMEIIQSYWNVRDGAPFLSTMWFLRDLMVCVLLAPILYQLLRFGKVSVLVILVFIALTILGFSLLNIAMSSILYFSMGGYFSIYGIKPFAWIKSKQLYLFGTAFILIICYSSVYTEDSLSQGYMYRLLSIAYNVSMVVSVIAICLHLEHKTIGVKLMTLGIPSYFIYLAHEPYMGYMLQILLKVLKPFGVIYQIAVILIPILYPIFIIALFYLIFKILKKYIPTLLHIAVGGKV